MAKRTTNQEIVVFNRSEYEHKDVPENRNPNALIDPLNINPRLAAWVSELIENRHLMNIAEQVRSVAAIARIQYAFMKLREERDKEEEKKLNANSGTEVKRFAKAFTSNAGRRRKGNSRPPKQDLILDAIERDDDESTELEY